jgi:hypothetical protein
MLCFLRCQKKLKVGDKSVRIKVGKRVEDLFIVCPNFLLLAGFSLLGGGGD